MDQLLHGRELLDLPFRVKEHDVRSGQGAAQLQDLLETFLLQSLDLVHCSRQREVHRVLGVELLHVIDLTASIVALSLGHLTEEFLVRLRPLLDGKLSDVDLIVRHFLCNPDNLEAPLLCVRVGHDASLEASVPWIQGRADFLLLDELAQHCDEVPWVEVRHGGGPSCPDAFSAIDQSHRNDGHVPLRLDRLALLGLKLEEWIIVRMENGPSNWLQACVNVPRACVVLATLQARSELTRGNQEVDVVGTDEVLRHANNRSLQGRLSVVVGAVFGNIPSKLCHLHVAPQIALECGIDDLPLSRLEAIHETRDGTHDVVAGETNELLIHEVRVRHGVSGVIHCIAVLVAVDPLLPVICSLLVEGQVDEFIVTSTSPFEEHPVISNVLEVLFALLCSGGTETFVVLCGPSFPSVVLLLPCLVVHNTEELQLLCSLGNFDDGRDELFHETFELEERWPPVLDHVEEQALDVGAIEILVRHNHNATIPQWLHGVIDLLLFEAQDLDHVLDLGVVDGLLEVGISDVQELASEREDSEAVTADDAETSDCQCLCTVSLCEDEGALLGMLGAGQVRIFQLGDPKEAVRFAARLHLALHVDRLPGFGPLQHGVDNSHVEKLLDGLVLNFALGPKLALLQSHRLLCLGVEGGIHDEAVHKHPEVGTNVEGLDLHSTTILLVHLVEDGIHKLVRHVRHVSSTFDGVDRVHEGYLLELALGCRHHVFPAVPKLVVYARLLLLEVELHIILELFHRDRAVIQKYAALLVRRSTGIHDALLHERHHVLVKLGHAESLEVGIEGDFREVLAGVLGDRGFSFLLHVLLPGLDIFLPSLAVATFDDKLR
mmetsp:Transcript_3484/g.8354  ORF Transcript_3484/g.8354 Transcript_3484/m.8354 type:complete len:832 (-) Transcript_3484:586-3081(-)